MGAPHEAPTQFHLGCWRPGGRRCFRTARGACYRLLGNALLTARRDRQVWRAQLDPPGADAEDQQPNGVAPTPWSNSPGAATDRVPQPRPAIVELLSQAPAGMKRREPDAQNPRGLIVPQACDASEQWPPAALVTLLPASLPLGNFTLLDFIGAGGMGQVWLASSPQYPGLALAVKFLEVPQAATARTILRQFHHEVQAGIRVSHSCILHARQLLDLTGHVSEGWPPLGLVMEYLPLSLARVLDDCRSSGRKLPQKLAIEFCRDLVEAIDELHRQRYVHRDIKPENVLLRLAEGKQYYDHKSLPHALEGARAVLADLGVICRIGQRPPFMLGQDGSKSPEQFADPPDCRRPRPDYCPAPAEDVWALGRVIERLAECVEGAPHFLHAAAEEMMHPDPAQRPTEKAQLLGRLSPDWQLQLRLLRHSGWRPESHQDFVGRDFVFRAFDRFQQQCRGQHQGGMFLIEGEAGVGKTALLTNWVSRGGPHPAFFFRYREGRTRPSAMPEALIRMLAARFDLEPDLPASEARYAERLAELLREIAAVKLGRGECLLVLVDGLDEAGDPLAAAQALPKPPLPGGVFIIVSSRPPAGQIDHLAVLVDAGACRFCLKGDLRENLEDAARFVQHRLRHRVSQDGAQEMARSAGGCFQLLEFAVDDIRAAKLSLAQALSWLAGPAGLPAAERLFAWYQESWQRITGGLSREDHARLVEFVCLMAAALAPLAEAEVLAILGWQGAELDWACRQVAWLLARHVEAINGHQDGVLQLRHQSVHDFLVSAQHQGPARHDLGKMHARIGRHFLQEARKRGWQRVSPYGRFYAVRHLMASGDEEALAQGLECLRDLKYLEATLGEAPLES